MLNSSRNMMPISDQAWMWLLLGSGGFISMPMLNAVWSVHPPIRMAATPDEAQMTWLAMECHRLAKSTKAWMMRDLPVPPEPLRNKLSWHEGGGYFAVTRRCGLTSDPFVSPGWLYRVYWLLKHVWVDLLQWERRPNFVLRSKSSGENVLALSGNWPQVELLPTEGRKNSVYYWER